MFICSCNGYRDTDLREMAREGVMRAEDAYFALGNGPCCGNCLECAQQIIDEVCVEMSSAASSVRDREARDPTGGCPC